jgi:diaminopimelate decarboxylase
MKTSNSIDDCLSTRGGHLFVEEVDAVELLQKFGSPLFVYSENQLRRNVGRFQKSFGKGWSQGTVKVMPAAKANWLPAVQRILVEEGCGCDVYSPGELRVALEAGFDPQFISVNGFPKDKEHIRNSIKAGARITIDSAEEVALIEETAKELDRVVKVRLRIKAPLTNAIQHSDFSGEGLVPSDIAALVYKNGLTPEDLIVIAPRLMKAKNVEIVGFHQHNGRHRPTIRYWQEQMKVYAQNIGRLCRLMNGFRPKEIDIGGGFAVPRDPFNAATHYSEPFQLAVLHLLSRGLYLFGNNVRYGIIAPLIGTIVNKPNRMPAPSIEEYAEACTRTLSEALAKERVDTRGTCLQLEPGRSMHGNAGIHLAKVCSLKNMTHPIRWRIIAIDTTEFWFTGGRYEHHLHDYVFANKTGAPMTGVADIVGRSCYGDRLLPTVPVPDVQVGDVIALLDTGSYQEVSNSNFNAMPRPATVLVKDNESLLIRRRETEEEIFQRDIVPERLKRNFAQAGSSVPVHSGVVREG